MMWEDYLNAAVGDVTDKYQARRFKAHIRAQLLERYHAGRTRGLDQERAMLGAMAELGEPAHLAERLLRPIKYQHGWLWLLSFAQLVIGVGIVAFSWKTESFAALALGRIMALWGGVSTGLQTRRSRQVRHHFTLLRIRMNHVRRNFLVRDMGRMATLGFGTGVLLALVSSLPWNVVNANMFHPVFISTTSALVLSGLVVGVPWALTRRWLGTAFYVVTLQAWAALSAALGSTALILWHQGFAPPPLFNWQPEMLILGGWLFNFAVLRMIAVVTAFKDRVLVALDDERSPLF